MRNIAILGAGFAGLRCAIKLEKLLKNAKLQHEWSVVLIDKNSYHTYTPALYEAASAYIWTGAGRGERQHFEEKLGGAMCLPVSEAILGKNITFVHQEVSDIDFAGNLIFTTGGGRVHFAFAVFALGAESIYFGIKGAQECCYGLKTLSDALRIRRRIEEIFAKFRQRQVSNMRVVVVGGGATGVEVIAETAKYIRHLANDFKINKKKISIFLLEAQDRILAGFPLFQRTAIEKRLKKLGVAVKTGAKISEVENSCVIFNAGQRCPADLTIWAAGVKGPALFERISGLELDRRGRAAVDKFLQVKNLANVFAIGDNASYIDSKSGEAAPPAAFIAEQQADICAKNVMRAILQKSPVSYKMSIPGYVLSCGGKYAVVSILGITFAGFLGWVMKRFIDLKYFLSILPFNKALSLWLQELRMFTKND